MGSIRPTTIFRYIGTFLSVVCLLLIITDHYTHTHGDYDYEMGKKIGLIAGVVMLILSFALRDFGLRDNEVD